MGYAIIDISSFVIGWATAPAVEDNLKIVIRSKKTKRIIQIFELFALCF
jgi:hypothetical protein